MGIEDKFRGSVRRVAERLRRCGWHRLSISAWCAIGLLGLGLVQNLLGPTQLDMASRVRLQLNTMAPMFTIRGIGDLAASVTLGFLFDRFENWTYRLLCGVFGWAVWVTSVQPLSYNLASLAVMMCLFGVGNGAVDIGIHVVLMKLWQDEAAPFLLIADFAFTLGALTAPLLAQPFLLDADAVSWPCHALFSMFSEGEYSLECRRAANTSCAPFRDDLNTSVSHRVLMQHNCIHDMLQNGTETYHVAYWIAAVPWLLCYLAFFYVSLTREGCFNWNRHPRKGCDGEVCPVENKDVVTMVVMEMGEGPLGPKSVSTSPRHHRVDFKHHPSNLLPRRVVAYRVSSYIVLFFFVMTYYGLLVTFGNLVFTFAVEGARFSKAQAADLNSLFWGSYTFARLLSVLLLLLGAPPLLMMATNVAGSFFSLLPMVLLPGDGDHTPTMVIWIGTAALGASMTSILPTTLTWLAQQVEVTGKVTAVVVAGAALGDMILPAVAEEIMAATSPRALLYFALVDVVIAGVLVGILFALSQGCDGAGVAGQRGKEEECKKLTDKEEDSDAEKRHRWTEGTS